MSSTPTPSPAPPTKVQNIEAILLGSLQALTLLPGIGATAGVVALIANIFVKAQTMYQQETGQPYDLSKIPLEAPVS